MWWCRRRRRRNQEWWISRIDKRGRVSWGLWVALDSIALHSILYHVLGDGAMELSNKEYKPELLRHKYPTFTEIP